MLYSRAPTLLGFCDLVKINDRILIGISLLSRGYSTPFSTSITVQIMFPSSLSYSYAMLYVPIPPTRGMNRLYVYFSTLSDDYFLASQLKFQVSQASLLIVYILFIAQCSCTYSCEFSVLFIAFYYALYYLPNSTNCDSFLPNLLLL